MARLKKKAKRKILLVLFLVAILFGSYYFKDFLIKEDNPIKAKINGFFKPKNPIQMYEAQLIATGDGLIHSPLYNAARKSDGTYDFTSMLTYTKEKLKNYDIKYYNQETVFDDSKSYSSYPIFNTPSAFGDAMIDAGFNMVSLATNHSMDAGATSAEKVRNGGKIKKMF